MESYTNYTPDEQMHSRNASSLAPVVICVSGGADSVALLHKALFSTLDIDDGMGETHINRSRIALFHLNHGLRGKEADEDEKYVVELAQKYEIAYRVIRADVSSLAKAYEGNIENAGREIRYSEALTYAKELSEISGSNLEDARILTAHTADDRAESFLINAMRGSGLSGLSSIEYRRGNIVRPLLHQTHEELEDYLKSHEVSWRIDQTNKDTSYVRSYVRYKVLSPMKERMPQASTKISSMCDVLSEEDDYMYQKASIAFDKYVSIEDETSLCMHVCDMQSIHPAILRRVIALAIKKLSPHVRMTSQAIKDVVAVLDNEICSAHIIGNIDVRIEQGILYLRKHKNVIPASTRLKVPGSVNFGPYIIEAKCVAVTFDNVERYVRDRCIEGRYKVAYVDTALLKLNGGEDIELIVDSMQTGDSIQPFGMKGRSKLVSDLLHEAHIPTHLRQTIPLIRDPRTGVIMCVGGIRTDERYSCRKSTKEFIQLSIRKG